MSPNKNSSVSSTLSSDDTYTKDRCIEEAKQSVSYAVFSTTMAYKTAFSRNWLNDVLSHVKDYTPHHPSPAIAKAAIKK